MSNAHSRFLTALLACAASAASLPAFAAAADDDLIKTERLADGIYLFRVSSDLDLWTATNTIAIVNESDVVVFDSNTRPATTRRVIAGIRKITDKPVRWLINSHWHMDHWSGNAEYVQAWPGVQIVATSESRDYMKRMGPGFFVDEIDGNLPQARAALAAAIESGKLADGTELTTEVRAAKEKDIADTERFAREMTAVPRVLPTVAFHDAMSFWSGKREFRLSSESGDATGSAVLYLPAERLLVTGDVLVRPENGDGPPPWTTNSYAIAPWLASLRRLAALDAAIIVPGQGPVLHDEAYLDLTVELYQAIIDQVHAALERGVFKLDEVQAAVDVDAIGLRYTPGVTSVGKPFKQLVASLVKKVRQESLDGAAR